MRRIVFAAIVAYTDRPTEDGRMLATPEGPLLHRPYPLPVFGWLGERTEEDPGRVVSVGLVEQAAVCDHRLIVFGRLSAAAEDRHFIDSLAAGTSWLEIDVEHIKAELLEPIGTATAPVSRFTGWKLVAAHIGEAPCWDLPPVQIEEFTHA